MTLLGSPATLTCADCGEPNRTAARYCRKCGHALGAGDPFDDVLGVDEGIRQLRDRLQSAIAQRELGRRPDLNTLLLGRGSTGKTLLVESFAQAARRGGLVESAAVVRETAHDVERAADLIALLDGHRGRIVEIVDGQALLPSRDSERTSSHVLTRFYSAMEAPALQQPDAPIIFLSGDPRPLQAHLAVDERFRKTFGIQIDLPDLVPSVLRTIAERLLLTNGAVLDPGASDRALARAAHLVSDPGFINAKSIQDDVLSRWLYAARKRERDASPIRVLADDIPDPVWVRRSPEEILAELDDLVGMDGVRDWLHGLLVSEIRKQERASAKGKKYEFRGHVILEGNPGTGKTTVVRHFARLLHAAGILPSERIVECSPSTLKGQFLGDSGKKMNDAVDRAMGGVLFIDEAHGLAGDPSLSRGADVYLREIAAALVPRLENDGKRFVAIFAGYPTKVDDALRVLDEGLPGRISNRLKLKDYTGPQLAEIFTRLATKEDLVLAPEAKPRLEAVCNLMCQRGGNDFANARSARTLFEQTERAMFNRADTDGRTIQPRDIPDDTSGAKLDPRHVVLAAASVELDAFVGIETVKRTIRELAISAPIERRRREEGIGGKLSPRHWLFVGNPGVGKTEIAKLMARLLYGADALLTPNLVSVVGKALQSGPLGPAQEVEAAVRKAQGGVLFIDEAYGLTSADAIDVLLTRLENDGSRFVAIAAGYPLDIQGWLTLNDGLERRFSRRVVFEDYAPEDLVEILVRRATAARFKLAPEVSEALLALFRKPEVLAVLPRRNAAMAVRTLNLMIEHSNARLGRLSDASQAALNLLTAEDLPETDELV